MLKTVMERRFVLHFIGSEESLTRQTYLFTYTTFTILSTHYIDYKYSLPTYLFSGTLAQKVTDVLKLLTVLNKEVYGSTDSKLFLTRSSLSDSTHIFEAIQEEKFCLLPIKLNLKRQTEVHALFLCLLVKRQFTFSKVRHRDSNIYLMYSLSPKIGLSNVVEGYFFVIFV